MKRKTVSRLSESFVKDWVRNLKATMYLLQFFSIIIKNGNLKLKPTYQVVILHHLLNLVTIAKEKPEAFALKIRKF